MTDSDSCFQISLNGVYGLNGSSSRARVISNFEFSQRRIDIANNSSCIPFMTELSNLFQCNIKNTSSNGISFRVQANNKHRLVKSYFTKFPLMSSKYLNYLCYLEGLNFLGKRLTEKEILDIRKII